MRAADKALDFLTKVPVLGGFVQRAEDAQRSGDIRGALLNSLAGGAIVGAAATPFIKAGRNLANPQVRSYLAGPEGLMRGQAGKLGKPPPGEWPSTPHVELVPTKVLDKFKEFERRRVPAPFDDLDELERLAANIEKHGLKTPLEVGYDPLTRRAKVGEGNHRLWVAKNILDWESLPATGYRMGNKGMTRPMSGPELEAWVAHRAKEPTWMGGIFLPRPVPKTWTPSLTPNEFNYFPGQFPLSKVGFPTMYQQETKERVLQQTLLERAEREAVRKQLIAQQARRAKAFAKKAPEGLDPEKFGKALRNLESEFNALPDDAWREMIARGVRTNMAPGGEEATALRMLFDKRGWNWPPDSVA